MSEYSKFTLVDFAEQFRVQDLFGGTVSVEALLKQYQRIEIFVGGR
jgi:hypothetical protein